MRGGVVRTSVCPVAHNNPLVSATWPDSVRKLAASFQQDPVRVTVGSDDLTANSRVEQVLEVFDDNRSKKYVIVLVSVSSSLNSIS